MEELITYILNNKVTATRLEGEVRDERNQRIPKRTAFVLLKKYARDFFEQGLQPRMIALSGLRGVGKTTLMWQTAEYVYKNHNKDIYFLSVDDLNRLGATLYDVVKALETHIYKKPLNALEQKIMLLIDEVHEAENWQKDLKILYEKGKKIFVLATGSSALLLNSSPDLASRWTLMKIYPFTFPEFILAKTWFTGIRPPLYPKKDLSKQLKNALFYAEDYFEAKKIISSLETEISRYLSLAGEKTDMKISALIDEYVSYHNIARFLPILNKTLIIERILALFERILYKDIPGLEPGQAEVYQRILNRLALSDKINYQTLAKDFRLKEREVENMIETLHKAEIINVFHPYGGLKSRTGMNVKAFFMSPSLRRALFSRIYGPRLKPEWRGHLYEDITAMYLKKNLPVGMVSFGAGGEKSPDFVIETNDKPVLLEVGTKKTSPVQISRFGPYRYGIIIGYKAEQSRYDDKRRIIYLPLSWALLGG